MHRDGAPLPFLAVIGDGDPDYPAIVNYRFGLFVSCPLFLLAFVGSVCGTAADPQDLGRQEAVDASVCPIAA